jgi:hypothetical protein
VATSIYTGRKWGVFQKALECLPDKKNGTPALMGVPFFKQPPNYGGGKKKKTRVTFPPITLKKWDHVFMYCMPTVCKESRIYAY